MLGFFLSCSWKYISFVLLLMDGDSLSIILGATRCPHASQTIFNLIKKIYSCDMITKIKPE